MNWILNAVLAMLMIAGSNLLIKFLQGKGVADEQLMFYQSSMVCISSLVLMGMNKTQLLPENVNYGLVLLHGLLYVGINVTILPALKSAPNPSYPLAIISANTIIVMLCAVVLLNEGITMTKGIGVLLVLAGVILVML